MALPRGVDPSQQAHGFRNNKGPFSFYLAQQARASLVILDALPPVAVIRHRVYLKGLAGERCTCAAFDVRTDIDPAPKMCVVCNASLMYDRIDRKRIDYVTVIRDDAFTSKAGKSYKDMKYLLELSKIEAELYREKLKAAGGNLQGMRYSVYRSSKQNSSSIGDHWQPLGSVNLIQHFWKSPAIQKLQEKEIRLNRSPKDWQKLVEEFVSPYNYDEILGVYDVQQAEQFIARVANKMGDGAGPGAAPSGGGPNQRFAPPPPPPPSGGNTVPVNQVPTYNVQPTAPTQPQTIAAPPPPVQAAPLQQTAIVAPPSPAATVVAAPAIPVAQPVQAALAAPAALPRIPDPVGSTQPAAPPPPPPPPPAPPAPPAQVQVQSRVQAPPPPLTAAPTPAQVAGQYNFAQQAPAPQGQQGQEPSGWSASADPFASFG